MRADARDNRARILTAAEEVFGRSPGASTDDVAKLADVGIATVFRHFPTKVELLEAVLTLRLERLRDRAVELAGAAMRARRSSASSLRSCPRRRRSWPSPTR